MKVTVHKMLELKQHQNCHNYIVDSFMMTLSIHDTGSTYDLAVNVIQLSHGYNMTY